MVQIEVKQQDIPMSEPSESRKGPLTSGYSASRPRASAILDLALATRAKMALQIGPEG